jgi:ligand-binding sensor domain-containing protein
MRIVVVMIIVLFSSTAHGQFPYAKKTGFPEQLPTQVVYDMLTDSKGYIWLGTNKGLYRFNGRTFVPVPFNNTSSKAVSYLQEDAQGVIWCMNFYNQSFYLQKDTLRKFEVDSNIIRELPTFLNMVVGSEYVWLHTFSEVYKFNKLTHKLQYTITTPKVAEQITTSVKNGDKFYAFTPGGYLFSDSEKEKGWQNIRQSSPYYKLIPQNGSILGISSANTPRKAFEISKGQVSTLPQPKLPTSIYIFHGVSINENEYWFCTKTGAYRWDKKTGETQCFFPNERVSDVVRDYQGNYWFSTLDNGVFVCPSLYNSLLKIYDDPMLNNFSCLQSLPNGEIVVGSNQGNMTKINLVNGNVFKYNLVGESEIEFLTYDTISKNIFSNRGVFKPDEKDPVELIDFSKGAGRDKFGNLLVITFNKAMVLSDDFKSEARAPILNCPLYEMKRRDTTSLLAKHTFVLLRGRGGILLLRGKRAISLLSSINKQCFWIGYDDGLYEYHYDGTVKILKDEEGKPFIAKSLQQQQDGSLVAGSSTKGVMIFKDGKITKTYGESNGLSNAFVRKVLVQGTYIWVLTDVSLDRIDTKTGSITNYFEEYGLSNTIVNDFIIDNGKILFATPSGILVRYNIPRGLDYSIKFPLLKATSNGVEVSPGTELQNNGKDITFHFEALHYLSANALVYHYRLKELDTAWKAAGNFSNQLSFSRLNPGRYTFEIKAVAGPNYKSAVKRFLFIVPRPWWQQLFFYVLMGVMFLLLAYLSLRQWKKSLLRRQKIKEQLLKSQLVALRAQMNPHFLYNVLNTVQGLVYGNRKTEAGELLGNFSDLMRKTLQASDKQLLPLQDEIENLRLYLELEKARFDEGFSYRIDIIKIDDLTSIFIPSLMLQPFAENSVKHGLMHKQGSKKVEILFEKQVDGLTVVIEDNGIGRLHSMEINQRTPNKPFSFATVALNERMDLFNRLHKQKITCRIIDKINERQESLGTRIELFIPDYKNDSLAL